MAQEPSVDKDIDLRPDDADEKIEDVKKLIKEFDGDCPVPSPKLKEIAESDLTLAIRFIGTKYNGLVERYQALKNKCAEECDHKYEGLKKKYTEACEEKKRLYNELIELKGNIRVFCRCRPLSSEEVVRGNFSVVEIDPLQESELQIVCSDNSKKQFKFDHVFGPAADQGAVFAETLPIVQSILDGYNVCIFAYGQTGTGKTFTMEGTPENRGVNYRALEELFKSADESSSSVTYDFSVSMLEVYNEKIRDLLACTTDTCAKRLEIKQAADGAQEVPGLAESQVRTIDEVWDILKTGARNRSVGSTNANELSSRSHCLVRVTVKSKNLVNCQESKSHMWLVDLAGSERIGKIEVEGERLKESQFINKSLSALGDVISALASKNPHIPYRNSKLTHLLQSSLGGDCKTLMFVQISPSTADLGETLCSLNFASRVRGIEHGPARKQSDQAESFKLKQMMEKLRQEEKETARLNESLQLMHLKYASRENAFKMLQEKIRDGEQACRNYQQRIRELESRLAGEKKLERNTSRFAKPPLAPLKQRPIVKRTAANGMPPPAHLRKSTLQNKENIPMNSKTYALEFGNNRGRARRVSLTLQPQRRSSMALIPSEREPLSAVPEKKMIRPISQFPRRSIATTFAGAETPDHGRKARTIDFKDKNASSPPSLAQRKSKIPTVLSPRQKLRLVRSPAPRSNLGNVIPQTTSKLCFSVQKRLVVGSPVQPQGQPTSMLSGAGIFNHVLRESGLAGKLGTAQRLPHGKRRMSIL